MNHCVLQFFEYWGIIRVLCVAVFCTISEPKMCQHNKNQIRWTSRNTTINMKFCWGMPSLYVNTGLKRNFKKIYKLKSLKCFLLVIKTCNQMNNQSDRKFLEQSVFIYLLRLRQLWYKPDFLKINFLSKY